MARTAPGYRCSECGWTSVKWVGRCGECTSWGTVVEVGIAPVIGRITPAPVPGARAARPITELDAGAGMHWSTGVAEFDRVLGGGIVPGSVVLFSGEPGVGKSTLLLEVAARVARSGTRVLYISAEESVGQVRLRAERTGALDDELFLASETDLATILGHIDQVVPSLLVVDSVQTVSSGLVDGLPGGPSQVREVASTLIRVAKDRALPLILVGHVTKDGQIAGPRLLEHLVDVVCSFDGDRQTALRFVRALKNRFGPTDEVGCFEMSGEGIAEVPDPSSLFLSRGAAQVSGTCVTIALEGKRAFPVEVQALIVPSYTPQPRRVVSGVDSARVAMILALLEKRAGVKLADHDVYVSTVGGVRLIEPGADLAIALALASARLDRALPADLVAIGELSLSGEVRRAPADRQRIGEAERLGFKVVLDTSARTIKGAVLAALVAPDRASLDEDDDDLGS